MHETVIARGIIDRAREQGDVEAVALEIGELAHVPGGELVACLRELVDWDISWTERPSVAVCSQCGFEGHPKVLERGHDFFIIECPGCGNVPDVTDGTDVTLRSVKVR